MRRAIGSLMAASVRGLLFLPLLDHLAWLGASIAGVAFLLAYLVARYWGSLLPHLAEFGVAADGRAGMHTALLYLVNILGAATGSIVTGFVLTDCLSLVVLGAALAGASFACAALLAIALPLPRNEKIRQAGFAAGLAMAAMLAVPLLSANVLEALQWKGAPAGEPLVHIVENRSGIITVAADGAVYGNGMYDGRFNTDLTHDTNGIVRPYALSLFHPAPPRRADDRPLLRLMGAGDR